MNESNNDIDFDKDLEALAAKLPDDIQPSRDLWPGIEAALQQPAVPRRSMWNSVWAQAAAVVVLVAGSSGVTYLAVTDDTPSVVPRIITTDNLFETVSGNFGPRYTLGNEYIDAREQLEDGLEEKLSTLTPTTRRNVVSNLNTIRKAIREINEAMANEPDNVLLQELLLSTYHEEMSLMKKVDGIANTAMRRNDI